LLLAKLQVVDPALALCGGYLLVKLFLFLFSFYLVVRLAPEWPQRFFVERFFTPVVHIGE
jgi:hypothetical protein